MAPECLRRNVLLSHVARAGALRIDDAHLFVCLFVCLSPEIRAAAVTRAGQLHCGCPGCLPALVKKFTPCEIYVTGEGLIVVAVTVLQRKASMQQIGLPISASN